MLVGNVVFFYGLAAYILQWTLPLILEKYFGYSGIGLAAFTWSQLIPTYVLVGLLLLLIGKPFNQGIALKEEQRYTG